MALVRRVYWDSCVIISHLEGTEGRNETLAAIFAASDDGELTIVTSAFSVSEVAYTEQERLSGVLDPTTEAEIDKLWLPGGPITLIDDHLLIGQSARALMRKVIVSPHKNLKGKDAIHIASALAVGADEMHTYDDLYDLSDLAGIEICEPRVEPVDPNAPPSLFDDGNV